MRLNQKSMYKITKKQGRISYLSKKEVFPMIKMTEFYVDIGIYKCSINSALEMN